MSFKKSQEKDNQFIITYQYDYEEKATNAICVSTRNLFEKNVYYLSLKDIINLLDNDGVDLYYKEYIRY